MRGDLESSAEKRASLAEEAGRSPRSAGFKYHQGAGAGGVGAEPEQSPTLTADWHNPAVYPIDEPITMADLNAKHGDRIRHGGHAQGWRRRAVGVPVSACTLLVRCGCAGGGKGALVSDEVSLTLSTSNTQTLFSEEGGDMVVRRLTPRECERLQGFPSDWTKIPYRGKPADECPDGPRYKAIGNSMAVPVMRWIGERIAMAEAGEIA